MADVRRTASREAIYGPEEIRAMRAALHSSWIALAFADIDDEREARLTRERLARSILRLAACGERRVATLTNGALGDMEPKRAGGERWRDSKSGF